MSEIVLFATEMLFGSRLLDPDPGHGLRLCPPAAAAAVAAVEFSDGGG